MNKLILIPLFAVIAISAYVLLSPFTENASEAPSKLVYENDFTFYDVEKIQKSLAANDIYMSTPNAITDHTRKQYCAFFDEKGFPKTVEYCTTTALVSSNGKPIGNLNLGGTIDDGPIMALGIIDVSSLNSKRDEVRIVFETMVETLVCNCWEQQKPGGIKSVSAWIDTVKEKYIESSKPTLKSKILGMDNKKLILEITSNDESYLWTFIIIKQV